MIYCVGCAVFNIDDAAFCKKCGAALSTSMLSPQNEALQTMNQVDSNNGGAYNYAPYYQNYIPSIVSAKKVTPFAIASFVLGLISILYTISFYISVPTAIVGIIMGSIAKKRKAKGLATAGLTLSIIGLAFSLLIAALFIVIYLSDIAELSADALSGVNL